MLFARVCLSPRPCRTEDTETLLCVFAAHTRCIEWNRWRWLEELCVRAACLSSVFPSDNNIRQSTSRQRGESHQKPNHRKNRDSWGTFGVANVKKFSLAKSLSILSILFNAFTGYGILYFYSLPCTRVAGHHTQANVTSFLSRMYYGIEAVDGANKVPKMCFASLRLGAFLEFTFLSLLSPISAANFFSTASGSRTTPNSQRDIVLSSQWGWNYFIFSPLFMGLISRHSV